MPPLYEFKCYPFYILHSTSNVLHGIRGNMLCGHDANDNLSSSWLIKWREQVRKDKFWLLIIKDFSCDSGDFDGRVPTTGTREWINQLGLTIKKPWYPWVHTGPRESKTGGGQVWMAFTVYPQLEDSVAPEWTCSLPRKHLKILGKQVSEICSMIDSINVYLLIRVALVISLWNFRVHNNRYWLYWLIVWAVFCNESL